MSARYSTCNKNCCASRGSTIDCKLKAVFVRIPAVLRSHSRNYYWTDAPAGDAESVGRWIETWWVLRRKVV